MLSSKSNSVHRSHLAVILYSFTAETYNLVRLGEVAALELEGVFKLPAGSCRLPVFQRTVWNASPLT